MKNLTIQKYVLSALFVFIIGFTWSQESSKYSHNSLAEKIYLQLDNEIYTNNKTIWFKAIVTNATTHESDLSSGVLYVELIDSKKNILDSKIIKLKSGIGNGFFDLNPNYREGKYLVRAYTEWNKNFNSDFIFKKYIDVFQATDNNNLNSPIQNIRRIDTTSTCQKFKIDFHPKFIDTSHKRAITVIVREDNQNDTITLKKNANNKFVLDRRISNNIQLVQLELITSNGLSYRTSFSPNLDYLDLQFFPESGKLVDGLSSKIGFKAIGVDGKGEFVEGVILNSNEEVITIFKSNELGMGHFVIDNVDGGEQYYAKLKSHTKKERILLPKVLNQGTTLTVLKRGKMINVLVQSNHLNNTKVSLKTNCRGYEYYNSEATLVNGGFTYKFPIKELPEGVISFILLDNQEKPIAERLYFNEREDNRLSISSTAINAIEYVKRDKINIDLKIKDSGGETVKANASMSVLYDEGYGDILGKRENILSYFLLSSDIKGKIESPGLYFKEKTSLNVDDLLLTQGWSSYKYKEPIRKFSYKKEQGLNVSGVVNLKGSKVKRETMELILMIFGKESSLYIGEFLVPGNFNFQLNDIYGDKRDIIIQNLNKRDNKKKRLNVSLINKKTPFIEYTPNIYNKIHDSIIDKIVAENRSQRLKEDEYYFENSGVTQLEEVIIDGYELTPKRKEVMERYGKPDVIIDGKKIKEKEKKWSYGLYSVLQYNFSDKVAFELERDEEDEIVGWRIKSIKQAKDEITLVVVDGVPVAEVYYDYLQNISVDEVISVEVIDNAKNMNNLFNNSFNSISPAIVRGSVVAIYTKSGTGLFGALKSDKSIDVKQIPVFSTEKEFYSPKHNIDNSAATLDPDLRSTIYWNPNIIFDEEGRANVNYYHSDNIGKFIMIIEVISEDGQIGYKTIDYTVIDKNAN